LGVIETKTYFCDCCPQKFAKEGGLTKVSVPCRKYSNDGTSYVFGESEMDLCNRCLQKFYEASDTHFAVIETSDIRDRKVIPHFEVEYDDDLF
jgi:hypothetical protein